MPIDDDTWGEFNIRQNGYIQKVNMIESSKNFSTVDELFVIQSWASYSASQAPNFDEIGNDCNDKYPKDDPWVFLHTYETDKSLQYSYTDFCGENGCFIYIMEVRTNDCIEFYNEVSRLTFQLIQFYSLIK